MPDSGSVAVKTRKLTQPTKKLDCPVTFHIKKLYKFPTFEIKNDTKWSRSLGSQKIRTFLKDIQNPSLTKQDDSKITADFEIGHLIVQITLWRHVVCYEWYHMECINVFRSDSIAKMWRCKFCELI